MRYEVIGRVAGVALLSMDPDGDVSMALRAEYLQGCHLYASVLISADDRYSVDLWLHDGLPSGLPICTTVSALLPQSV